MPGIVVFRRRWSVGSDDFVVPGVFLFTAHFVWAVILILLIVFYNYDLNATCIFLLWKYIIGYLFILTVSMMLELTISIVAMKGNILDTAPRTSMEYILYLKLVVMIVEMFWIGTGVAWIVNYYTDCQHDDISDVKKYVLALVIFNTCLILSVLVTIWCTYDSAGRSWVKMKKYQRSMRESESKFQYKRSGNANRNWRQRKVLRAYQNSWDQRCRILFCCMRPDDRNRNSFADIARLLSDFFRDLDVVPSDVVAGLVLLRKFQKTERDVIVQQRKKGIRKFMCGVPITSHTQFVNLNNAADYDLFLETIHYMHFAMAAYGWPVFVMAHSITGLCQVCTKLKCCSCFPCLNSNKSTATTIVDDNCCHCNFAALDKMVHRAGNVNVIYATFHVDVGETPFFIAVDYDKKKVVISIRGTLSMKDVLTDLNAESETLPVQPTNETWFGHKGMVHAAVYIKDKLLKESLLNQAFNSNLAKGTAEFGLVIVGHSLGAGTASILAILLRQFYPDLKCFSYSPPGGLLSASAVDYSKEFTVSVVVGKDVVPRIGLYQMESLRADLINAIKRSVDPKWKTISCSVLCCGCAPMPTSVINLKSGKDKIHEYQIDKDEARQSGVHPSDSSIALTIHHPLYPPGRIIHIVRHHVEQQSLRKKETVYEAIWADNEDFDEVLISPVMIQDHMPDKVLEALTKVLQGMACKSLMNESNLLSNKIISDSRASSTKSSTRQLYLETSFANQVTNSKTDISACKSSVNSSIITTKTLEPCACQANGTVTCVTHPVVATIEQRSNEYTKQAKSPITRAIQRQQRENVFRDELFGLAPLASPETLSEISSISSRTSVGALFGDRSYDIASARCDLYTPKKMSRSLKFTKNLSTYAKNSSSSSKASNCDNLSPFQLDNNTHVAKLGQNIRFDGSDRAGTLSEDQEIMELANTSRPVMPISVIASTSKTSRTDPVLSASLPITLHKTSNSSVPTSINASSSTSSTPDVEQKPNKFKETSLYNYHRLDEQVATSAPTDVRRFYKLSNVDSGNVYSNYSNSPNLNKSDSDFSDTLYDRKYSDGDFLQRASYLQRLYASKSSNGSVHVDQDIISNLAIDLNLPGNHRS